MNSFDELFPIAAKNRQAKKSEAEKAREEQDVKLFSLIDSVFRTDNGQQVLKLLKEKCRYQSDNAHFATSGQHLPDILYRYEAQRAIYLWLRKYVNKETLKKVEIGD